MKKKIYGAVVCTSLMFPAVVMASEPSGTANSAVVSAMTTTANDMIATGTSILPVALGVVSLALVVIFGIKMFKRIANK